MVCLQSAAGKVVVTKPIGFDRKKKQGRGRPCYATSRQAGLSSFVVEQAAEFAIRAMLRDCGSVKANISANDFQLLGGAIDGVTIDGREWCSPLGLR